MTNRRRTATLAGVAAVAGGAVTATVLSLTVAGAASTVSSSAYGIAGTGSVPVSRHAAVSSTDGAAHAGSVASYSTPDHTLTVTDMRSTAGAYSATSNVATVSYLDGKLKLTGAYASCNRGKTSGGSDAPRYDKKMFSAVSVTHPAATKNSDGSVTRVGAVITVRAAGGFTETLTIASATCSARPSSDPTHSTGTATATSTSTNAPAPPVQTTHLPVTR